MKVNLSNEQFMRLSYDLSQHDKVKIGWGHSVMNAICTRWMPELRGPRLSVLLFVLNRTLYRGTCSQQISNDDMASGIYGDQYADSAPTGFGVKQVQKSICDLEKEDFLIAYSQVSSKGGTGQCTPRIYEINFKKLLTAKEIAKKSIKSNWAYLSSLGGSSAKRISRTAPRPPLGGDTPPLTLGTRLLIDIDKEHSSFLYSVSDNLVISPSAGASGVQPVVQLKERSSRMFVGKANVKSPATGIPSHFGEARAMVKAIQDGNRIRRVEVVKNVEAKNGLLITLSELQTLLDKQSAACDIPYRLIATGKWFGFLKKRMQTNCPADFSDFLRYTLSQWRTLATQNAAAIRKDQERLASGEKPIPATPHFEDIARRYPYLFRCYVNQLANASGLEKIQDHKDQKIKALSLALDQEKKKVNLLRRTRPSMKSISSIHEGSEPAKVSTRAVAPISDDDLMSPVEFLPWDSVQSSVKTREARHV